MSPEGMHRSATATFSKLNQTEVMDVLVEVHPFGRPIRALAAPTEMPDDALLCVSDEVVARVGRVAFGEVVEPAADDRVDVLDHNLDGCEAIPRARQVMDLLPNALLRLRRRLKPPVTGSATLPMAATIPKPVAEEVYMSSE